jgi:hypothetical protein
VGLARSDESKCREQQSNDSDNEQKTGPSGILAPQPEREEDGNEAGRRQ